MTEAEKSKFWSQKTQRSEVQKHGGEKSQTGSYPNKAVEVTWQSMVWKKKLKVVANLKEGSSGMKMPYCEITEGRFPEHMFFVKGIKIKRINFTHFRESLTIHWHSCISENLGGRYYIMRDL